MTDTITIRLDRAERQFLVFLSERGNEVDIDHNGLSENVIKAINELETKMAILSIKVIGTSNTYQYKLTPIGINLVDMIRKQVNG
jgi:hypothetical protein